MMIPPDMRDLVGEHHTVRFHIAAVDKLDVPAATRIPATRENGHSRTDPSYFSSDA